MSELGWESQDLHTRVDVMQILTTRSVHSYRLAAVPLTVTPRRKLFYEKSNPRFGLIYRHPTFLLVDEFYTFIIQRNILKNKR